MPVRTIGSSDSVFYGNVFEEDAHVIVDSMVSSSSNVSFYDNMFFGEFHLMDVTSCFVIANIFQGLVFDDGSDNYWDENDYFDYDGTGPYEVPGLAGSMDINPIGRQGTTSVPFPSPPNGGIDLTPLLIEIIFLELVVIALILVVRRRSMQ
jgi:hypothetical protein